MRLALGQRRRLVASLGAVRAFSSSSSSCACFVAVFADPHQVAEDET